MENGRLLPLAHTNFEDIMFYDEFIAFKLLLGDALRKYEKIILWGSKMLNMELPPVACEFFNICMKYASRIKVMNFYWNDRFEQEMPEHPQNEDTIPPVIAEAVTRTYGGEWLDMFAYMQAASANFEEANEKANESLGIRVSYVIYDYALGTPGIIEQDLNSIGYFKQQIGQTIRYYDADISEHQYEYVRYNVHHCKTEYLFGKLLPEICNFMKIPYD